MQPERQRQQLATWLKGSLAISDGCGDEMICEQDPQYPRAIEAAASCVDRGFRPRSPRRVRLVHSSGRCGRARAQRNWLRFVFENIALRGISEEG